MPGIETLPTEILEQICLCIVPPENIRKYDPLRRRNYHPILDGRFRVDCAAMRQSCKTFSMLRTPPAALFYDFNVFATSRSLDIMELLSQHPVLRNYVHRLIFCRPAFQPWLGEASEYLSHLRYSRRHPHETPYTSDQERAGLRAYQAGLREQRRLLRFGEYSKTCGRCMSRFPRLSSIFISDEVPKAINPDIRFRPTEPTLFQRQHPDVLLTTSFKEYECESPGRHISNVLQALAVANVQIEELIADNYWGPSHEFSIDSIPGGPNGLDFSKLSRLDLSFHDAESLPGRADLSTAICPLLEQMPALTELYLHFIYRRNEYPIVTRLWRLNAPKLAILLIQGLTLTRPAFYEFLRRHIRLRELTLYDVKVTDGQRHDIIAILYRHPRLKDLDVGRVDHGRLSFLKAHFKAS